jgi:hypothetical protein
MPLPLPDPSNPPIQAHQRPLEDTRTKTKTCFYEAVCMVDGVHYTARSRNGVVYELARVLVAAGLPDGPLVMTHEGLKGNQTWRSFHEAALWTLVETEAKPLHRIPYARAEADRQRLRNRAVSGQKQGGKDATGTGMATDALEASRDGFTDDTVSAQTGP